MSGKGSYIIAEAGVNHNGSLETALKLVEAARGCGADAVKFQTFCAAKLVTADAAKASYQESATGAGESQLAMLRKLELQEGDFALLAERCRAVGIDFLSTPFDEESADRLDALGMALFKVASGEITNFPLLRHIAGKKRGVILSTGMSTLEEVAAAVEVVRAGGAASLSLLHCVTEYPAPYEEINLRAMLTLREAFALPTGYSDHTPGVEIPLAAVALGARIIEKHFTLDKGMRGPDHRASLDPGEFRSMVTGIRRVESALGDGVKRVAPCEEKNLAVARRSVVSARELPEGTVLVPGLLCVKRPGTGISPADLDRVVGLKTRKAIAKDEVLQWENLE